LVAHVRTASAASSVRKVASGVTPT
jgi:hypothetical protein